MSDKFRRVGAWVGIILLVSMYLVTLLSAIFAPESSKGLFLASLFCTFVVPVWIYVLQLFYKRTHPEGSISIWDVQKYKKQIKNGIIDEGETEQTIEEINEDRTELKAEGKVEDSTEES